MQIVIDIHEEEYAKIKESAKHNAMYLDLYQIMQIAIVGGIPLPEGHGRLKDSDEIANMVSVLKNNWDRNGNEYESGRYESYDYAIGTINDAPTIIEADAESEE